MPGRSGNNSSKLAPGQHCSGWLAGGTAVGAASSEGSATAAVQCQKFDGNNADAPLQSSALRQGPYNPRGVATALFLPSMRYCSLCDGKRQMNADCPGCVWELLVDLMSFVLQPGSVGCSCVWHLWLPRGRCFGSACCAGRRHATNRVLAQWVWAKCIAGNRQHSCLQAGSLPHWVLLQDILWRD